MKPRKCQEKLLCTLSTAAPSMGKREREAAVCVEGMPYSKRRRKNGGIAVYHQNKCPAANFVRVSASQLISYKN